MSGEPLIEVVKPGLLSTVQDRGRPGLAHLALSRGGAMDREALALANAMVGNAADEAGIEITGPGPTVRVLCDAWIATVGARHACLQAAPDEPGPGRSLPAQRPVFVRAGATLRWLAPEIGWRSWIAVAGGLALPSVLGSRSAHLAAAIGPGRLAAGQRLALHAAAEARARRCAAAALGRADPGAGRPWPSWQVAETLPRDWPEIDIPALAGRHLQRLSAVSRRSLLEQHWVVGPQSNRQGIRLHGEALDTGGLPQLASEPVSFGTVQLPPAGEPMILMGEHQTTGGYPRILEVASAAQALLAQAAPGSRIRFRLIGLDEADRLARQRAEASAQRVAGVGAACAYPSDGGE